MKALYFIIVYLDTGLILKEALKKDKIVNGSGQKASGTNGKFSLSVKGNTITIKSKKSIQEYKEAFYLTFMQNVSGTYKTFAGTNSPFGVNVIESFTSQNLMEVGCKVFY